TRDKVLTGPRKSSQDYSLNEIADKSGITLYLNGHPVRVYAPGPAHTRGDLLVYFPDQHTIATGDLFLNNSCPYMDDVDLENWVRALDEMLALPIEHAVPGHFAVAGKADLSHFRNYLADLQKQVSRLRGEGLSLKQVQASLKLGAYRDLRQFPQFEATFADN